MSTKANPTTPRRPVLETHPPTWRVVVTPIQPLADVWASLIVIGVQTLDGETYNGEWAKGLRHGVGTCNYTNGGVYEGAWFQGQRHGFGVYDYVRSANADAPHALPPSCLRERRVVR